MRALPCREIHLGLDRSCRALRSIEQQEGGCQLNIALFSEIVAGPAEEMLFPYNALRNAALLAARTPLVMNVDTDMLLSAALTATLSHHAGCASCGPRQSRDLACVCSRQDYNHAYLGARFPGTMLDVWSSCEFRAESAR